MRKSATFEPRNCLGKADNCKITFRPTGQGQTCCSAECRKAYKNQLARDNAAKLAATQAVYDQFILPGRAV